MRLSLQELRTIQAALDYGPLRSRVMAEIATLEEYQNRLVHSLKITFLKATPEAAARLQELESDFGSKTQAYKALREGPHTIEVFLKANEIEGWEKLLRRLSDAVTWEVDLTEVYSTEYMTVTA